MNSLSVLKWEIFQGKKNSRKQNHRTWIIKYPTKRAVRLVKTIFHKIPRALIMHVRWNMIYWLTKKEISKNSPAFLGYNHFPFVKNNWKVRQVFARGSTYFLKPLKNTRFDFFFFPLMTRFRRIHRCNAFLSESLRATIWGVFATVLRVTIKSYFRLIFVIKKQMKKLVII